VSLLEPIEELELDLTHEAAAASESGLDFRAFPIPDRGIPSRHATAEFTARLAADLRAGKNVGLHCRQGVGRSALVAAATLISSGVDAATALSSVSSSRGIRVPETEEQREWLLGFRPVVQDLDPDV
jgi:protein-tyrosine phosphatase